MPGFVTETWLRQHFGLAPGSEVHLPATARLTPAAEQLLGERQIRVKHIDSAGQVYVGGEAGAAKAPVHPLTGANRRPGNRCAACAGEVRDKGELLTLLDDKLLVPKTHARIALRGKLDTLIAQTIWVQTQFDRPKQYPVLHKWLADLRSYMGNVLRSEVTGADLPPLGMGDMDCQTLHALSHHPLKYLGHDHLVPEADHGDNVALLNLLRALVREAELAAVRAFINDDLELLRPDIVRGLNRLSSALYVLMLMTVVSETGAGKLPEQVSAP
ncbi:ethanolamine utilization cob(I)yrinic acid a,c-diamide adenosyltransferase EutT [Exilibacterium tricleocarpae]|uniref:Ethanolamine utilization cob(I)yrinic acid a,c-diamide adenosyltransferase EutT n=1 Tax=Exilibacterium tricleocarpae TaxID=2591008 RepID=A0A545TVX7_9GAMM|nr:ethanolamine utilization cob(I)yrinic acid a,c-diamide adenosyltransferase EutT [Exilibacterium tricleocarpae]